MNLVDIYKLDKFNTGAHVYLTKNYSDIPKNTKARITKINKKNKTINAYFYSGQYIENISPKYFALLK